jgi:23S rRNA (cytidine2498-2'-O)-methyltransferase
MATHLHLCKTGFEQILARELPLHGEQADRSGSGWVLAEAEDRSDAEQGTDPGLCFATESVLDARLVEVESVNKTADALCQAVWQGFQGQNVSSPWLLRMEADNEELAGRLRVVRGEFRKRLKKKMGRLASLAQDSLPELPTVWRGLYARLVDYDKLVVGNLVRDWGQRRMKDEKGAPSRSFLKVEEAYGILGRCPAHKQTVVDLGAAPGGWSFSAAEKGALVQAVDNGPLKGEAKDHPGIRHVRDDAFRFHPQKGGVDWLFCDLIEDPYLVLDDILLRWLDHGWCKAFVVNLKVGKMDPIGLLRQLLGDDERSLVQRCRTLRIRQLFHDREEITCVGEVAQR